MARLFQKDSRVRFLIGDARYRDRLYLELDGVDSEDIDDVIVF